MHPKSFFLKTLVFIFFFGFIFFCAVGCQKQTKIDGSTPKVYILETESGSTLIRNGKAFVIKGAAAQPFYLEDLKKAGANTVRIYDTIGLLQTLNKAESLGLAAVIDIPLPNYSNAPQYYEDPALFKEMRKSVLEMVRKYKDHPALLYWNLGNEIKYPEFHKDLNFFANYRSLVDDIHKLDDQHPISTTIAGASRKRLRNMILRKTHLDFFSFNIFGGVSSFPEQLGINRYLWDGQYVISEWGVNGPWENSFTSWQAPIEETSTKKAEHIRDRYIKYILPLEEGSSLGSLVFYWGRKNEVTPTWFSFFGENNKKTQAVFELEKVWKNHNLPYNGPVVDYMLLNGKGALESVVLLPGTMAVAVVVVPTEKEQNLDYNWEIRKESWFKEDESNLLANFSYTGDAEIKFTTPVEEGPYRLFVYLTNGSEYMATANFPFYVLNPENGK